MSEDRLAIRSHSFSSGRVIVFPEASSRVTVFAVAEIALASVLWPLVACHSRLSIGSPVATNPLKRKTNVVITFIYVFRRLFASHRREMQD